MLDLKFIREHPDLVREGIRKKGDADHIDDILKIDERRRDLLQNVEALKNHRNTVSEQIGKLKKDKQDASSQIAEMEQVKTRIKAIDDDLRTLEDELHRLMLAVPNVPHPSVPVGKTPADNQEIATWGERPVIDFKPKSHWELLEKLDIIDFERGVKISGAGFPVYKGQGAKLQRALINFFLDEASSRGYREIQS